MTDAKKCDNCGKIGNEPYLSWVHIDPIGFTFGHGGELDLCSWECAAVIAGQRARERVARVQPPADELPEADNPF